VARSV
jgi:hypothetical protein